MDKYTVLVTGGNGCLGQHIVRLLQEKADFVTHIKVLDLRKFSNELDYKERKPIECFVGDITDTELLEGATCGVDCVIHVASFVDARMFQNEAKLYKVNVTGTEKLLQVCIRQNVRQFVYCSSQGVILGYDDLVDSDETFDVPEKFLFGYYSFTKHLAEQIVGRQNGANLSDGYRMQTLIIRPVSMYGELDANIVPNVLGLAGLLGGFVIPFAHGKTQAAYAGNVAWGFVCAAKAMKENPDLGGETFFMCDDTPLGNMFQLVDPFMKSCGFKTLPIMVPYWINYIAAIIVFCIACVISPVLEINTRFTTANVRFINMRINSVYTKAEEMLNYKPLFSHDESIQRSIQYYKHPSLWLKHSEQKGWIFLSNKLSCSHHKVCQ